MCNIIINLKANPATTPQVDEKVKLNSKILPIWKQKNLYRIISNENIFALGSKKITGNWRCLLYWASSMKCWLPTHSPPSPPAPCHLPPSPPHLIGRKSHLESDKSASIMSGLEKTCLSPYLGQTGFSSFSLWLPADQQFT